GAPGVLLMHGNLGSARWWSWIAPFLARDRRVVSLSFAGMGLSDFREDGDYLQEDFLADALAVAEQSGLFDSAIKPIFVGHSAGGGPAAGAAALIGDRLSGVVIVDSSFKPPHLSEPRRASTRVNKPYPDVATGLSRYRFAPPQPCENLFIADFIARASLKEAPGGVVWRFDPRLWKQFRPSDAWECLPVARCPLAFVNGAKSSLTTPEVMARIQSAVPAGTVFVDIPEAYHHVMVDQPIALTATLEALFESWAPAPPTSRATRAPGNEP
ncbi:MAG: alpha/beta hydrolase, partial [Brevundimonas sp.]|nr:alpha/beta hydrolase [Brevundimonas sp.]